MDPFLWCRRGRRCDRTPGGVIMKVHPGGLCSGSRSGVSKGRRGRLHGTDAAAGVSARPAAGTPLFLWGARRPRGPSSWCICECDHAPTTTVILGRNRLSKGGCMQAEGPIFVVQRRPQMWQRAQEAWFKNASQLGD